MGRFKTPFQSHLCWLYALILIFNVFVQYCSAESSLPPLRFNCEEHGAVKGRISKHAHPQLCHYFINCIDLTAFLGVCPPKTAFNPATNDCDFMDKVQTCSEAELEEMMLTEWTVDPPNPKGIKVNSCAMRLSGNYPLEYGDCTKYVECSDGNAKRKLCQGNQMFDVDACECQEPEWARCWMNDPTDEDLENDPEAETNDYVDDNGQVPEDIDATILDHVEGKVKKGSMIQPDVYYFLGVSYKTETNGNPFGGGRNNKELAKAGSGANLHIFTTADADRLYESYGLGRFEAKKEFDYVPHEVLAHDEELGGSTFNSTVIKNDGEWMVWQYCPKGKYVIGVSALRRAKMVKGFVDNVGVIALSLECVSPHDLGRRYFNKRGQSAAVAAAMDEALPKEYISWVAPDAPHTDVQFSNYFACEDGAFAIGFQLNQDLDHGRFDDMATANMKLLCSFGPSAVKPYWQSEYQETSRVHGEWTDSIYCKPRQVMCGANTQMMKFVDKVDLAVHDNTGLNNLQVRCCDVPNPALECTPVEKEVRLAFCDNSRSHRARPCELNVTLGTAYDFWRDEYLIYFYESVGFTRENQIDILSEKFIEAIGQTGTYKWKNASHVIWLPDETSERRINVAGGWQTELFQIIAECGYYVVHTNKFYRMDTDVVNGRFTMQYFDLL